MVAVKLIRTIGALQEEYGRIRFDGSRFYYDGLSSIFITYLERSFIGTDKKRIRPENGIEFLKDLKRLLADTTLQVTDILRE